MPGENNSDAQPLNWPIHPRPILSESLESWVNRFAFSNLFSRNRVVGTSSVADLATPLHIGVKLDTHPGVNRGVTIEKVSKVFGVSSDDVAKMCLSRYVILGIVKEHDISNWSTGVMRSRWYCPRCLQEDQVPYFRLTWRLAFAPICVRHRLLLTDMCPSCRTPVYLRITNASYDIAKCCHCLSRLAVRSDGQVSVRRYETEITSNTLELLDETLDPSDFGWQYGIGDYFKSLDIILKMLIRVDRLQLGMKKQMASKVGAILHDPRTAFHFLSEAWPLLQDVKKLQQVRDRNKAVFKSKVNANGYTKYLEQVAPKKRGFFYADPRVIGAAMIRLGSRLSLKALSVETGYKYSTMSHLVYTKPELRSLWDEIKRNASLSVDGDASLGTLSPKSAVVLAQAA